MASSVCEVLLSETAIVAPEARLSLEIGGIVDFWGVVRATEGDAEIIGIEYEAHWAMAEHQLRGLGERAADKFTLMHLSVHHRVGFVPVGEASLFVRVGSRHRASAFRASEWIVDELKKCAPIWKHPRFQTSDVPLAATRSRA